ncbi:MAG: hypothetical protein KGZ53_10625 [Peptococcaceae bacterium]|jgi:hypothetical protein|nr:hypothetical protein [Peptococcaceae bacterium]
MEILIFLALGIVWTVIQALMKSQQPKPDGPRPVPRRIPVGAHPRPDAQVPGYRTADRDTGEIGVDSTYGIAPPMEVIEFQEDSGPTILKDDLVQGIIMAEVLGPPRARVPRNMSRRR